MYFQFHWHKFSSFSFVFRTLFRLPSLRTSFDLHISHSFFLSSEPLRAEEEIKIRSAKCMDDFPMFDLFLLPVCGVRNGAHIPVKQTIAVSFVSFVFAVQRFVRTTYGQCAYSIRWLRLGLYCEWERGGDEGWIWQTTFFDATLWWRRWWWNWCNLQHFRWERRVNNGVFYQNTKYL